MQCRPQINSRSALSLRDPQKSILELHADAKLGAVQLAANPGFQVTMDPWGLAPLLKAKLEPSAVEASTKSDMSRPRAPRLRFVTNGSSTGLKPGRPNQKEGLHCSKRLNRAETLPQAKGAIRLPLLTADICSSDDDHDAPDEQWRPFTRPERHLVGRVCDVEQEPFDLFSVRALSQQGQGGSKMRWVCRTREFTREAMQSRINL
eukprot:4922609-Amphidinium_carterae.1